MISLYSIKTGALIRNVSSIDGEKIKGIGQAPCPDDFERMRWDVDARGWVACEASAMMFITGQFDDRHRADNGADSINQARRRLVQEARLWQAFKSSILSALITAEAQMRGMTADALAEIIIQKDQQFIDREIARKRAKLGDIK